MSDTQTNPINPPTPSFRFLIIHNWDVPKVTGTNDEKRARSYVDGDAYTVIDMSTLLMLLPSDCPIEGIRPEYQKVLESLVDAGDEYNSDVDED